MNTAYFVDFKAALIKGMQHFKMTVMNTGMLVKSF